MDRQSYARLDLDSYLNWNNVANSNFSLTSGLETSFYGKIGFRYLISLNMFRFHFIFVSMT